MQATYQSNKSLKQPIDSLTAESEESRSMTPDWDKFQAESFALNQRALRLSASIVEEARRTARAAGLDPRMPFLHAHNALCSFEYGNPWAGVNYDLTRRVLWLEKQSFLPSELVDRLWRRRYNRYAAKYWPTHAQYAEREPSAELIALQKRLRGVK